MANGAVPLSSGLVQSIIVNIKNNNTEIIMSSGGTIQFRQSRTPHVEEPFARKLKTRSSLTPAPETGLSSQPSNARDTGEIRILATRQCTGSCVPVIVRRM